MHAFALDGTEHDVRRAAARSAGTVHDRWSFDEHDGLLRVATALGPGLEPAGATASSVLDEDGETAPRGRLASTGSGKGEQIQSVRWFDDLAVVVTFRQTDPLYTVDLSDAAGRRRCSAR